MKPETLDQLFRSLPREKASEFFTERVMARVREKRAAAPARRTYAVAFASLLVVIGLASAAGWRRWETQEEARLAAARAEQVRLERELDQIKEMTAGLQPVVYVGSTQDYDVYIDLRALEPEPATVVPASYRTAPRPGV
ncbi:MAG TPA: hypothetical protein VFV54_07505 [Thermoanaerobaculia bacterium]|nr:hypothetical protein [Thermoanaerobaculia bacterium]